MSLRTILPLISILTSLLHASPQAGADDQPNILFIISDDQRPDTIGALGNTLIETPHLDTLVKQGTTFTRAICANPLCVPSRAEILTGSTGFRNGVHPPVNMPDLSSPTWPGIMARAGYRTFHVGKWMIAGRPSTRGYQESLGLFASGKRPEWPQFDSAGRVVTGYRGWMFQTDDRTLNPDLGIGLTYDISSKFANAAIEFIKRDSDAPFFLQVNFTAPHDPLLDPPNWLDKYPETSIPLPANFKRKHPFDHGNLQGRDERLNSIPRKKADIRRDLATYYRVISDMDEQIGRILSALAESGKTENTLIIFTSDHGLALGSHGLMGKQNMYEHSIAVPLIFKGPMIPTSESRDAQCYLRDLFPTVCDYCGIEIPTEVEGTSLMPVLDGSLEEVHQFVIGYYNDKQRMIRMGAWKYIYYPAINKEQLFHLATDPNELKDLSNHKLTQQLKAQLREEMVIWLQNHGDPLFQQ